MSEHGAGAHQEPVNWTRRLRIAAALVFFVGLTAAFVDFRELVPVWVGKSLAWAQFVPSLLEFIGGALVPACIFVALLLVTLLFGRLYCSVICPLGIFQDVVSRVGRLFRKKRVLLPYRKELTWVRHAFVWTSVAAVLAGWGTFALSILDPYSNYGRIASGLFRPSVTWLNNHLVWLAEALGWHGVYRVDLPLAGWGAVLFSAAMLSVVLVMSALRGRLYCNTVCPVGTVLGWVSKFAAFRIGIDKAACTKCANCIRACKAQCIDLKAGTVDFSRCVGCQNCVSACDEQGIGYKWSWGRKAAEPSTKEAGRRSLLKGGLGGLLMGSSLAVFARKVQAEEAGKPAQEANKLPAKRAESLGVAPPGSRGIALFLERCSACQLCVSACPKHVLQPSLFEYGLKGFMKPRLDFTASFCDYDCRVCAEACPDGAIELMALPDKQLEQIGIAHFHEDRCIVKVKGTDCAACSEHCPTKAVETIPYGNNLRLPQVNESLCIGCGACQFACPVVPQKAIVVTGLHEHGRAVRVQEKPGAEAVKAPAGDFPF